MNARRSTATLAAATVALGVAATAAQAATPAPQPAAGSTLAIVQDGSTSAALVVVSPSGQRRDVVRVPRSAHLADWTSDGAHALVVDGDRVTDVDVARGSSHSFRVDRLIGATFAGAHQDRIITSSGTIGWTTAQGVTQRRTTSGRVLATISTLVDWPVPTADRRGVLQLGPAGVTLTPVAGGAGHVVPATRGCEPVRAWSATEALLTCRHGEDARLEVVALRSGAAHMVALEQHPRYDVNAWAVGGRTYVARVGGCTSAPLGVRSSSGSRISDVAALGPNVGPLAFVGSTLTAVRNDACTTYGDPRYGSLVSYDVRTGAVRTLLKAGGKVLVTDAMVLGHPHG